MKTTRAMIISLGALMAVASVWGQTVDFVTIIRRANNVQTGPSTVTADPTTPFSFRANVEGTNMTALSPITAATFDKPPGGSPTALTFDTSRNGWTYDDDTQTSMANLNSVYGTGSYTFNLTGTPNGASSVTVSSFASTLLTTPLMTLSGGSWVGNSYVINSSATLTISFNPIYSGSPSGTQGYNFDVGINGMGYIQGPNGFANYDPTNPMNNVSAVTGPANFVVNPNTLAAGSYTIQANYADIQNPGPIYSGAAFSASLLEYQTNLSLTVIPEPSTYAEIFGLVAMAGVIFQRRRRVA